MRAIFIGHQTWLIEHGSTGILIDPLLCDDFGLVEGDLQIWDIVGVSVQSWFDNGIFDGLIPFFYSYYGENGSPELLAKIIRRGMRNLELSP